MLRIHVLVPFLMIKFSRCEMETSHYLYQNFNFSCRGTDKSLCLKSQMVSPELWLALNLNKRKAEKSLNCRVFYSQWNNSNRNSSNDKLDSLSAMLGIGWTYSLEMPVTVWYLHHVVVQKEVDTFYAETKLFSTHLYL